MKTLMNGLLKGRITRWGFLAVLLIAVGASVGWETKETTGNTNWEVALLARCRVGV